MNMTLLMTYFAPFADALVHNRFQVIDERYDAESFGNACVELDDGFVHLRFIRDRCELFVDIRSTSNDEWYHLDEIVRHLDGDVCNEILRGAWDQDRLALLAAWFAQNYRRVQALFTDGENFAKFQVVEKQRREKRLAKLRARSD